MTGRDDYDRCAAVWASPSTARCVGRLTRALRALARHALELRGALDDARSDVERLRGERDSARLGCDLAYRREPTQAEGDAFEYEHRGVRRRETHVPMGDHHGHRCACGVWVWGKEPIMCRACAIYRASRSHARAERAERERDEARAALEALRAKLLASRSAVERAVSDVEAWWCNALRDVADAQRCVGPRCSGCGDAAEDHADGSRECALCECRAFLAPTVAP